MAPDKRPAILLWAVVASAACFAGLSFIITKKDTVGTRSANVPVYGEMTGNYTFTDQEGQTFQTNSMRGQTWLVNFFFTSCHGPCPLMTSKIATVMTNFPNLRALSLTTDLETDTVEVLKDYSNKFKADPTRWTMARGQEKTLQHFGQDVLKLPVGEVPDAHSARVVLIDKLGQIRGWYDSQEPGFVAKLTADTRLIGDIN